jgi:hypothetical protein
MQKKCVLIDIRRRTFPDKILNATANNENSPQQRVCQRADAGTAARRARLVFDRAQDGIHFRRVLDVPCILRPFAGALSFILFSLAI